MAQGLIYHYFGGKEELLFAAADRHGFLPRLRVILAASCDRPAREVLLRIVEGFRALLGEKERYGEGSPGGRHSSSSTTITP